MIGDDIEIVVTDIKGKSVKIGIISPDTTKILRKELMQKIEDENMQAQASSGLFSAFFNKSEP